MESKRFPRVNSLKPASPDDPERKRFNGQQPGATKASNLPPPVDLGGNESPAWQEYFFLAPNVRFTRTPDYEAKTHRPERDQIAAEQNEPLAPPAPSAMAKSTTASHAALPPQTSRRPPASSVPSIPAGHTSEKARAVAPIGPRTAAPVRTSASAASAQGMAAPVKTPGRDNVRWPFLSDHVFFELMAPYMIEGSSPAPRAAPVPRAATSIAADGPASAPRPLPIRPRCFV